MYDVAGACACACVCESIVHSLSCRFASIYKYDWNLFKRRFLGPDGVLWLQMVDCGIVTHTVCVCFFGGSSASFVNVEALEAYWASVKNTEWFKSHPILSSPDAWIIFGEPVVFQK